MNDYIVFRSNQQFKDHSIEPKFNISIIQRDSMFSTYHYDVNKSLWFYFRIIDYKFIELCQYKLHQSPKDVLHYVVMSFHYETLSIIEKYNEPLINTLLLYQQHPSCTQPSDILSLRPQP